MQHDRRVGAPQMRHRRCSRQCPGSSGRVKYSIVGTAEIGADANTCLIAHDRSSQESLARGVNILRRGQGSGKYYGSWMKDRPIMYIVLLHDMRGRAIHEGSEEWRRAAA